MFELIIVCDTNDGDYVTEISKVSKETIDKFRPLIAQIKAHKGYSSNYSSDDMSDKSMVDQYPDFDEYFHENFSDYCPYGEYGFHTIESIVVQPLPEKEKLL